MPDEIVPGLHFSVADVLAFAIACEPCATGIERQFFLVALPCPHFNRNYSVAGSVSGIENVVKLTSVPGR